MADQAQVKERPVSPADREAAQLGDGIRGLLHRLILLAELQAELLRSDLRAGLRRLIVVGVLLCGTVAAGIAAMFLFMFFIAQLLVGAGLYPSWAFLLATVIDLALTISMAFGAFLVLRSSLQVFHRSRDEWRRTIRWAKDSLSRTSSTMHDGKHP